MISVLIFFGGICQYIVGIMEFVSGNTFGATVFSSYGAFNISYSMIYLPGSGIIAAYTDPDTGLLSPDFAQSLALYLWAWFILTVIFTVAAMRSSWVLFLDLLALDVTLLLLAVGNMLGSQPTSTAGFAFGYLVAALSCTFPFQSKPSIYRTDTTFRLGWLRGSLRGINAYQGPGLPSDEASLKWLGTGLGCRR